MIDDETRAKIRQLFYAEHFTVNAISESVRVHHSTVKKALELEGRVPKNIKARVSALDPFKLLIDEKLEFYSKLSATRLMQILQDRGYKGGISTLRNYLRLIRLNKSKVYMKMVVHPGEQAQVDWAHSGEMKVGGAVRKLYIFVMVLSYSRAVYAEFTFNMHTSTFLRCHESAFKYFNGIPRVILYDNLKSVVLQRRGPKVRFNPQLIEFSGFYHYEPRPCNVFSGNEKGRVERTIRYLRGNFLAARHLTDIKTANESILKWCTNIANKRVWPDNKRYLVESMWKKELSNLIKLSGRWMEPKEQRQVIARKSPWIKYDLNSYSIPPGFVGQQLQLNCDDQYVFIFHEDDVIAKHKRCYDCERFIEIASHRQDLINFKNFGRGNLFRENIVKDFPKVEVILSRQFDDGLDIPTVVRNLYQLRYTYGDALFEAAIEKAIKAERYTIESIRYLLNKQQLQEDTLPPTRVTLPEREDVKTLEVKSNSLTTYDEL